MLQCMQYTVHEYTQYTVHVLVYCVLQCMQYTVHEYTRVQPDPYGSYRISPAAAACSSLLRTWGGDIQGDIRGKLLRTWDGRIGDTQGENLRGRRVEEREKRTRGFGLGVCRPAAGLGEGGGVSLFLSRPATGLGAG